MQKSPNTIIFWFRRDLRLDDNCALFHALTNSDNVLPIFIFDSDILNQLPKDDARVQFISDALADINTELQKHQKSLAVFHGKPLQIIRTLLNDHTISAIYTNKDYEPYAIQRDKEIEKELAKSQIDFKLFKDQVIFEQDQIVKDDGKPYIVFTPYSKKWKAKLQQQYLDKFDSKSLLKNIKSHEYPFLTMQDIGFTKSPIIAAKVALDKNLAQNYDAVRNFPALDQTTRLSVHLRFGTVSIRTVVKLALQNEIFLNELIWREFFMQILWHFPQTVRHSFKPKYDAINWRNNEMEFQSWCNGMTGYPIVDAGMRELNATGFMHNRVRMVVASFLCKHLLIDWRWGETYFALKLLDYEQSANVGNWQWASGSGVDAAPYFRIFNPTEQVRKFDNEHKYIRRWIPEIDSFNYPMPIVDHKEARERCLQTYKEALN